MSTSLQTLARRTALVLGSAAVAAVTAAGPAGADVPEGWSNPEDVSAVHALLVLVGIPLLLFVLIFLAVYLPGLARGERNSRGSSSSDVDSQWFGGPRQGTAELADPDGEESKAGGASARW